MYQLGIAQAAAAASPKFFLYQPGIAQAPKADVSTGKRRQQQQPVQNSS